MYTKEREAYMTSWGITVKEYENLSYKYIIWFDYMNQKRSFRSYMRKLGYKSTHPVRYSIKDW